MTKRLKKPCRNFVRISCSAPDALPGSAGKAAGMSRKVSASSVLPIRASKWRQPSPAGPWKRSGLTRRWLRRTAPCSRRRAGGRAYAQRARNAAPRFSPTLNSALNAAQESMKKNIAPSAESRLSPARNSVLNAARNQKQPDSAAFLIPHSPSTLRFGKGVAVPMLPSPFRKALQQHDTPGSGQTERLRFSLKQRRVFRREIRLFPNRSGNPGNRIFR